MCASLCLSVCLFVCLIKCALNVYNYGNSLHSLYPWLYVSLNYGIYQSIRYKSYLTEAILAHSGPRGILVTPFHNLFICHLS